MIVYHRLRVIRLAVLWLLFSGVCFGLTCKEPTDEAKRRVASYVHDRYQIPAATKLVLEDASKANAACFWKMSYRVGTSIRSIVVYLTPDRGFVTPALYDLSTDPLAEAKESAKLLQASLAPQTAARLGSASSAVTIVEFSDFECPYCKKIADTLERDVLPKEKDKVSLVFRNFPLPMHPWAKLASEMGECARMQKPSVFWLLHDYFFQNQSRLTLAKLESGVKELIPHSGIDEAAFDACVARDESSGAVTQDVSLGQRLGVHGTPTLFVNGFLYTGARDAQTLSQVIEAAAAGQDWRQLQRQGASAVLSIPTDVVGPGVNECRPQPAKPRKDLLQDVNAISEPSLVP